MGAANSRRRERRQRRKAAARASRNDARRRWAFDLDNLDYKRSRLFHRFCELANARNSGNLQNPPLQNLKFLSGADCADAPEFQLFCAANAVAILVDFIYQIFLFTPLIVVLARFEERQAGEKPIVSPRSSLQMALRKRVSRTIAIVVEDRAYRHAPSFRPIASGFRAASPRSSFFCSSASIGRAACASPA